MPARLKGISPRVILIGVVLAGAIIFVLYDMMSGGSAGGQRGRGEQGPAPVRVATAQLRSVPVTTRTIGTVLANATVEVKSRIDGQIVSAPFREGDIVRAGQVLFQVDPRPWQEALRQAEAALTRDSAQLQSANAIANRTVRLSKIGAASGQERDIAIANARALAGTVAADKAAVQQARLQLGYTRIVAPIAGKTGPILVHAGNLVRANDTEALVTVTQLQPVKISFALPQSDLPALQERMRENTLQAAVSARSDRGVAAVGGANQRFTVRVDFIGNTVSNTTGTVELRASYDNPDMRLVPGEQVDVIVRLAVLSNVIQVPRDAVNAGQDGSYVFMIERGKAAMRNVQVLYQDEYIAAVRGVRAGETVVTDGQLQLTPGKEVRIVRGAR